jgi:hypothetical protein
MTFIFVGSKAEPLGKPLTAFGQSVEMAQEVGDELILHQNIPMIPESEFAETEGAADRPLAARIALHHYREALREKPAEEITHERI